MTDSVAITLIICTLVLILAIIHVRYVHPFNKKLADLSAIVHELIGLSPTAKARWGMPEPDEILSELQRLKGEAK